MKAVNFRDEVISRETHYSRTSVWYLVNGRLSILIPRLDSVIRRCLPVQLSILCRGKSSC